ncbi:MAG: hypothetical protein M5U12_08950 [Verrucomicrobia bacterium]|nr:hypothetical protein [Verrucomicrobiota bacterium]
MKAWDIYTGDIYGPHPCVLISCQARIDAKPQVVVLKCSSMKPGRERLPKNNEAILDQEDGLDWRTLCRCDLLFTVEKSSLSFRRGNVSLERRREIARKLVQGLAIAGL